MKRINLNLIMLIATLLMTPHIQAQVDIDLESGGVFSGYNDVRIPGDTGTQFSLSEELEADPAVFYRIRVHYHFNQRNHLGVLFAPLSVTSGGKLDRHLFFEGKTFPANTPLETTFKFNSYRLFYRYDLVHQEKVEFGLGITAKIRDAKIAVKGGGLASEKTNVGFVPLIHFRLLWRFAGAVSLLIEGDALAAPQGRAEDVLAALLIKASPKIELKAGYRILEGGADNDVVYNFTLLHYAAVGVILHF